MNLKVCHNSCRMPPNPERAPKGHDPKPKRKRARTRLAGDEEMSKTMPSPPPRPSQTMLPPAMPPVAKPAIESGIRLRPMFDPSVKWRNEAREAVKLLEEADFDQESDQEGRDWEKRLQMIKLINFISESKYPDPDDLAKQSYLANDLLNTFVPADKPVDPHQIKLIVDKVKKILSDNV